MQDVENSKLSKHQKNKSWVEEVRGNHLPLSEPMFFLGVKDVENSKPVFDPDFHAELIIKDEYEDSNLGEMYF